MAVTDRLPITTTVLDRPAPVVPQSLSEELRAYYSSALNKTTEEVAADVDAGLYPILKNELEMKTEQNNYENRQGFIDFVLATQPDVESAAEFIRQELAGNIFEGHTAPDIAAILSESGAGTQLDRQIIERSIAAQRIIDRHAFKYEGSWGETISGFADSVVSEGLQNLLGGVTGSDTFESGWQLRDLAKEAGQLLYMNLPPEEFEKEFEAIIQRVEDMGFLSDENPFFFAQFVDMIREGGVGETSDDVIGWAGVDLALAPLAIPFGVIKGGARSVPRVLTQVGGSNRAANLIEDVAAVNPNSPIVVANTAPSMITPGTVGTNLWAAPDLTVMRSLEANNVALNQVKQSLFGNFVDQEVLNTNYVKFLQETQDRLPNYPRQEINYEIRSDEAGNIFGGVILGRRSSGVNTVPQPWSSQSSAQKFADRIGGEVLETMHNGSTAYVVRKEVTVATGTLADATDTSQVATGFLSGVMSTTARTTVDLDGRIKQAEAQIARTLSLLNTSLNKVTRRVSTEEKMHVDNLFRTLRDDPLYNYRTEAMPTPEFVTEFTNRYGYTPSQEVQDYYTALSYTNDVDYYLTADRLFKEAVNNNEEMVRVNGNFYRSKRTEDLPPDTLVYDPALGRYRNVSDYDPKRVSFYHLNDTPTVDGNSGAVRFVALDNPTTRRLYHTDVLPYNIGGHRTREGTVNFYLKQERDMALGSGETITGKPRTFMGVRLETEAKVAVQQFNNIVEEVRRTVGSTPPGQYRAFLTGNSQLDALVRANNDWNLSLDSIDDFVQMAEDYGLDITRTIDYAEDGMALPGQGFVGANTVGEHFRTSNRTGGRSMKPLMNFGGMELESIDPTTAIQRGYVTSISRYGNQGYLHNAIVGWLKAAKGLGVDLSGLPVSTNPRQAFEEAINRVGWKGREAPALRREHMTIKFRLNSTTADVSWYQTHVRRLADFVYGTGSKKGAAGLDWLASKDPTQFFRSVAFHAKLGLFALPQLYVQASQIINIVGIVGPKTGMQAGLGYLPMRLAMVDKIPPAALQRIAAIQTHATGLEPQEFLDLVEWVKRTGRNVIDQTVVEENNTFTMYKPGLARSVLDKGLIPFREGELVARITAAVANRLEMKAQGFAGDIFSDSVTRKMIHRQDVLTGSMTSASSAPWQKSMLSLPLQFTTYHVRLAEQIFMGTFGGKAILTPKERISLGFTHLITYGAAGHPFAGWLMDKMAYENGIQVDTISYELARYGSLDAMLSLLTGEDTALSTRLAAGEGVTDLFRNIFSGDTPFIEVISGPGGGITNDVFGSMLAFGRNMFSGNWDYTTYDFNRLGRNISSYEMVYRLWLGHTTGEYISRRTQDVMMTDLSQVDTLLLAAGVPIKEMDYMWSVIENEKAEKRMLETHITEIRRLQNIAIDYINEGNYEAANRIALDMGAMLQVLKPYQQEVVYRRLRRDETIFNSLIKRAIEHGKPEIAEALQNYMRN